MEKNPNRLPTRNRCGREGHALRVTWEPSATERSIATTPEGRPADLVRRIAQLMRTDSTFLSAEDVELKNRLRRNQVFDPQRLPSGYLTTDCKRWFCFFTSVVLATEHPRADELRQLKEIVPASVVTFGSNS